MRQGHQVGLRRGYDVIPRSWTIPYSADISFKKKMFDLLTAKDKTELSWYFLYPLACLGGWAGLRLDQW